MTDELCDYLDARAREHLAEADRLNDAARAATLTGATGAGARLGKLAADHITAASEFITAEWMAEEAARTAGTREAA